MYLWWNIQRPLCLGECQWWICRQAAKAWARHRRTWKRICIPTAAYTTKLHQANLSNNLTKFGGSILAQILSVSTQKQGLGFRFKTPREVNTLGMRFVMANGNELLFTSNVRVHGASSCSISMANSQICIVLCVRLHSQPYSSTLHWALPHDQGFKAMIFDVGGDGSKSRI